MDKSRECSPFVQAHVGKVPQETKPHWKDMRANGMTLNDSIPLLGNPGHLIGSAARKRTM